MGGLPLSLAVCVLGIYVTSLSRCTADTPSVEQWLQSVDTDIKEAAHKMTTDEWAFFTNVTTATRDVARVSKKAFAYRLTVLAIDASIKTTDDPDLSRQLELWSSFALQSSQQNFDRISLELELLQHHSEVSSSHAPCYSDDFNTSREWWRSVHDSFCGGHFSDLYSQHRLLTTPFPDEESINIDEMTSEVMTLYRQLHGYVRYEMQMYYGPHRMPVSGHIPAHLVDGADGASWYRKNNIVQPFRFAGHGFLTPDQELTVEQMLKLGEEFYQTLGFQKLPDSFWKQSQYTRGTNASVVKVCRPSKVWNFQDHQDFRITGCLDVSQGKLLSAVDMVGKVVSQRIQSDLPFVLQHNSVADTDYVTAALSGAVSLAFVTPAHLRQIGIVDSSTGNPEEDEINFLMEVALDQLPPLAMDHVLSQWQTTESPTKNLNRPWWKLRCTVEGVSPPVPRNKSVLDLASFSKVLLNRNGKKLFQTAVAQFQILKALCETAGHTGSLSACNLRNSSAVGDKISNMLQLGSSKPWPEALEQITGTRHMDVGPLLEYFRPLQDWLEEQNAGQPIGWSEECPTEELTTAAQWLRGYNQRLEKVREESTFADWNYESNITDETSAVSVQGRVKLGAFQKEEAKKAEQFQWRNLSDVTIRRQFHLLTNIGPSAMENSADYEEMQSIQSKMDGIYGAGKVCLTSSTDCVGLEPDLEDIMATSHDYDHLLTVWEGWRNVTGRKMKSLYEQFAALSNKGVQPLGYADTGEYWRSFYESPTFQRDLKTLLDQLSPLYEQLHAYVRRKLMEVYGEDKFPETGHIPAHLLGNMWAQEWNNIFSIVQPYKNRTAIDVTAAMEQQNYSVKRMFETAEAFFSSLGFERLPQSFWNDSIMEKPSDRDIVCHASAWDFYNAKDFRIKMCTSVNQEDLVTIHHEMGHIQYFMQYRHQPQMFRDGANPGFHEAVGDTIALSVNTPSHLRKINLLEEGQNNELDDINFLLKMALEKVAFLPFGYLIDQWRWSVFSGDTPPDRYNQDWWNLRCRYQGISSPVPRSAEDFDPGAKYHVPGNTPYIRYFVSFVVQFQFHQALCKAAGYSGPVHHCDIFQSEPAGKNLRSMLSKGSSIPWPDVLKELTGDNKLDASALLEYFRPLQQWLEEQNAGERLGWTWTCPTDDQLTRQIQSTAAQTQQPSGSVSQSEGRTTRGLDQGQTSGKTLRETVTREQTTRHAATGDGSNSARQVILGVDLMLVCLILSHVLRK